MKRSANRRVLSPFRIADVALSQKLAEELQYETEAAAPEEPDFLKSFNAQGVWKVCTPSLSLQVLTRTDGVLLHPY